jgi:hypothetical protein
VDWVSTPDFPPPPDGDDLRGLARGLRRLFEMAAQTLTDDAGSSELAQRVVVVAGTEGVTASFIKELIRRTVLVSLRAGDRPPVLRDEHFAVVLAEMNSERQSLTRSLLGAGIADQEPPEPGFRPGPRPRHPIRVRRFPPG